MSQITIRKIPENLDKQFGMRQFYYSLSLS